MGIIYKAINNINGKCYIGKTIGQLEERKYEHLCDTNACRDKYYFHKAIRKYGINNFKWKIIYKCKNSLILNIMETMKIIVEHSHISEGKGYNMTWGGDGAYGYKHTEETKKKMSNKAIGRKQSDTIKKKKSVAMLKRYDEGWVHPMTGKKNFSRSEMNKKQTGENNPMYGKHHSEETKKKISEMKKTKKRILQYE